MTRVNQTAAGAEVLYDEDCGLCRWLLSKLLAWDRRGRLRPVPIGSPQGARLLADMSEEERLRSWHLVADGRRASAGAAVGPLMRMLPGGRPLARLAEALPGATERAYRLVADNRSAFGRLVPKRAKQHADERIRRRAAATGTRSAASARGR